MRSLAGVLLVLLGLFMAWGFVRAGASLSDVETLVAVLVAVALPAGGGAWLLAGPLRHRRRLEARKDVLGRETLESEVVRLARRSGGRLTTVEVVAELGIREEAAKAVLSSLVTREMADMEVTESGVLVYSFHDLRHLHEKPDARGVLDA